MISNVEIKLINKLIVDEISVNEFYQSYPIDLKYNENYFYDKIYQSIENKNQDTLEICLNVSCIIDEDESKLAEISSQILDLNWITKIHLYEEALDYLPTTKDYLKFFKKVLESNYLQVQDFESNDTFMVPIWSKALWKIYQANTSESKDIISMYRTSSYEYLRTTAEKLLKAMSEK